MNKNIDNHLDNVNLEQEIAKLKFKQNAVILAHYYQDSEIQDIADFIGDSLELSKKAMVIDADIIVFCGVKFMAETAFILNPNKKILVPDLNAGCSLEQSCKAEAFQEFRKKYAEYKAITYINCSAEVKALSDIIVTSSNAEKIINSIPSTQPIMFSPDQHLGQYLIRKTNRPMLLWNGSCIVHESFSEQELIKIKTIHPKARIIAHPECTMQLLEYAEYIGSTSKLIDYVTRFDNEEFIVLTEPGIIHQMSKSSPNNIFYDVPSLNKSGCLHCSNCPYMKLNTLKKVYLCMLNQYPQININPIIVKQARKSLDNMLALS